MLIGNRMWSPIVFTIITIIALLNHQTSIFYIVYFFWWNEVIEKIVDWLFARSRLKTRASDFALGLIWMAIMLFYLLFVFIIFIGFAGRHMMEFNIMVLFFTNPYFNLSVLVVLIRRIYMHVKLPIEEHTSLYQYSRMGTLHISMALGGAVILIIQNNYPHLLEVDNAWVDVATILPFLFINLLVAYFASPKMSKD